MDEETREKCLRQIEEARERLRTCDAADFPDLKKKVLNYVRDWPGEVHTKARMMVSQVQMKRKNELSTAPSGERRSASVEQFLAIFDGFESLSDALVARCKSQFEQGRKEVIRKRQNAKKRAA